MKALIIDDERLARTELIRLLEPFKEIEIVGEAINADDAHNKISELNPDVIFLDIQMPGKSGFDLLEELDKVPKVVFTTAYDEYALKAFEYNALDYLLKPIEPTRLEESVKKLLEGRKKIKFRKACRKLLQQKIRFLLKTARNAGLLNLRRYDYLSPKEIM